MYITEDNKKTFRSIIILNEMIYGDRPFQTVDNGDDAILEPLFIDLMSKGYVQTSGLNYQITAKGREVFDTFMKRYTEYLRVYDIYAYVDLEKGEFAFSSYYDFDTDDAWYSFIDNERFDDLRIAVAIFKKLDPAEIVFMSFINENRFDATQPGWQIGLMDDTAWSEIEEICATAIKPEEVGEDAMVDMITQGSQLMMDLLKEEQERNQQENNNNAVNNGNTTTYTETIIEEPIVYYEPYYDPFYVSPIWFAPLFLW